MRLRRLLDPLALVIVGAGAITAVLTGAWWIGALGVAGWAIVAAVGGDPEQPVPEPGMPLPELEAPYAQVAMRLDRLRTRIAEAIARATPLVRGCMEEVPSQVEILISQCRGLLAKQAELDRYLGEVETDDPGREIERLAASAAKASDPAVQERWRLAEAAARSRLEELARIRTNRDRTVADLAEVEARLKQVLSQVVAMDSVDQSQLTGLSCELRGCLSDLSQQVAVMERVLRPLADPAQLGKPGGARQTQ